MKQWIEIWHTKKKGREGLLHVYMKMVQAKRLLVIPNLSYEHFSEVMVNVNDL